MCIKKSEVALPVDKVIVKFNHSAKVVSRSTSVACSSSIEISCTKFYSPRVRSLCREVAGKTIRNTSKSTYCSDAFWLILAFIAAIALVAAGPTNDSVLLSSDSSNSKLSSLPISPIASIAGII